MRAAALCALAMVACSSPNGSQPDAATCEGAAPATALIEGFCKHGEADRCFYGAAPVDDF